MVDNMDNIKKEMKLKSFDFAESTSKQLITLSTAIVAFTITFGKELFGGVNNKTALIVLIVSWLLFILCIVFGVWTLMALTGSLDKTTRTIQEDKEDKEIEVSIYDRNITVPEFLQVLFFVLALAATIAYAIILAKSDTFPNDIGKSPQTELRIKRESTYKILDSIKVETFDITLPNE